MSDLTVRELTDQMHELRRLAVEAAKRQFPLGSAVMYKHGNNTRFARVVDHNRYSPRLRVEGRNGSTYWLDAVRVIEESTP